MRTPILVLSSFISLVAGTCPNNCSLNGVCVATAFSSTCRCDDGWTWDDCSRLDLLPAPSSQSFHGIYMSVHNDVMYDVWCTRNARTESLSKFALYYSTTLSMPLSPAIVPRSSLLHMSIFSFAGLNQNRSSWGGSVLHLPDGTGGSHWVMFAAEMTNDCTLRHWTTNSEVVMVSAFVAFARSLFPSPPSPICSASHP